MAERDDEEEVRKYIIEYEVQQQHEQVDTLTWREKRLEWVHEPAFNNTMQRLEDPKEETEGGLVLGDNGDLQWDEAMPPDVWKINKVIILLKGLEEPRLETKTCEYDDDDDVNPPEPFHYSSSGSLANGMEGGEGNAIAKLPLERTQSSAPIDLTTILKPVDHDVDCTIVPTLEGNI